MLKFSHYNFKEVDMRKIAYILSFVMLPLVAMAGDIKYTRPVLTLKNDTLTVEFSMSVEDCA